MNKKRILILLFVLTIAVGFTMTSVSSVSAAKKTMKFKDNNFAHKNIGGGDRINLFSAGGNGNFWGFDVDISIQNLKSPYNPKHKLTKAKVKFVKKTKVQMMSERTGKIKTKWKTKYMTKTFKAKKNGMGSWSITNYAPNRVSKGWKPYSAVIYYKKI